MRWLPLALVLLTAARLPAAEPAHKQAPSVAVGGVVNAAGFTPAPDNFVAPGGIISIFGVDLSLRTKTARAEDLVNGRLPLSLGGVAVYVGHIRIPLFYVSPDQINAQVPLATVARERPWPLVVVRESLRSNETEVHVRAAAPGLFPVVTHADFSLVGRGAPPGATPARPGDVVILFGSSFGPTTPVYDAGRLAKRPAELALPGSVRLDERTLPPDAVLYTGLTPGFAGLYQVNVRLPKDLAPGDWEVFVEVAGAVSQPGVRVAVD